MNPLKQQIEKSLQALFLELPESIATDVKTKFYNYSKDIEEKLLQATRNLGHPAYGHSYNTTEAIDTMRNELFDLLDIPKKD